MIKELVAFIKLDNMEFILIGLLLYIILYLFGLRSKWIAKELFLNLDEYKKFPNFWTMTLKFWVWNIQSFKRE